MDPEGWRLPAPSLERAIADIIAGHLSDLARTHRISTRPDLLRGDILQARIHDLTSRHSEGAPALLAKLLSEGHIQKRRIVLKLRLASLADALEIQPDEIDPTAFKVEAPFALRRRGVEGKVIVGDRMRQGDRTLLRTLSLAHGWAADLRSGKPLSEIAAATGHSASYIRTRAQLAFLSPAIQRAILDGHQPAELTLERIVRKPIPLDWNAQARLYGFVQAQDQI